MSKVSRRKRSAPAFDFFGWFVRTSQRAVQAMKSLVSCSSLRSDDSFAEYLARILGDPNPNAMVFQDSREESSPSSCSLARAVCSFSKSNDSFAQYLANALRNPKSPVCFRESEEQTPSTCSMPLKACSSPKTDDSFAVYLANNAIREQNTLDFRDNRDETLSTSSVLPRDACSSPSKSDVTHAECFESAIKLDVEDIRDESLSTCSLPREAAPPDVWSKRNGGRSPAGFVGKLGPSTSTRLAAICKSQKSQIFEGLKHTIEASESVITSTYVKVDTCQCVGENMISAVSSAQPKLPANFFDLSTKLRLRAVKQFLDGFEYRLNSVSNFQVKKLRPLSGLMATAKLIIYQPEPIKCVEAVFIALFLTAGLQSVDRIPLGFKTQFANQVFQHIVLLVQYKGKYGAFGISRSPDLMSKEICYDSMSSIIEDFKTAYEESDHIVLNLQIGLLVEHNIMSSNFVCWQHLCLYPATQPWPECVAAIENHALRMKHLWNVWVLSGRGADPTRKPLNSLRKAPLHDGLNKRVIIPMDRKAVTCLQKSLEHRRQFEGHNIPPCRQAITSAPELSTVSNKNECCQRSHGQQNPLIPSATISVNKSLLTGFFDPRDFTGPWKYTQCSKHRDHGATKCGSLQQHENEGHNLPSHASECGPSEQNPRELCKQYCDCGSPLCKADSKLFVDNRKNRSSGPLYDMVLKRSRAR